MENVRSTKWRQYISDKIHWNCLASTMYFIARFHCIYIENIAIRIWENGLYPTVCTSKNDRSIRVPPYSDILNSLWSRMPVASFIINCVSSSQVWHTYRQTDWQPPCTNKFWYSHQILIVLKQILNYSIIPCLYSFTYKFY